MALASAAAAPASEFFVAPNGTPAGNGSRSRPWDLATAFAQPASVRPGDTILLLPGVYRGEFRAALRGRPGAPVVAAAAPGARVTIDGTLKISGSDAWYRGFEVTSSAARRVSSQKGPYPTDVPRGILETEETGSTGAGLKLIDLVAHDLASVALWKEAVDMEVSGCLVYYNGWAAPDRGHGHGIYVQNVSGTKRIADNVIFENFDNGIQAYGSEKAGLDNLDIEGNTIFENGAPVGDPANNILVGGGRVAENTRIIGNVLWYATSRGTQINLGYDPYGRGADHAVVRDNVVVNGEMRMNPKNGTVDLSGNRVFASLANLDAGKFPSNRWERKPVGSAVYVRPDRYEKGRAIVTVFNAERRPAVRVDLSSVLRAGDRFEVRNAQDVYGAPVGGGVFRGGDVDLPMKPFEPASPVGWKRPAPTGPDFNVFVVTRVASAENR